MIKKRIQIGLFVFFLTIILIPLVFVDSYRSFIFRIGQYPHLFISSIGEKSASFFSSIYSCGYCYQENQKLVLENQKLLSQVYLFSELKKENHELRKALKLPQAKEFNFIDAIPIGLVDRFFLLINKGQGDGIKEGMPLITSQNVLVGKIKKVYLNNSLVETLFDPNFKTEVEIGKSKTKALIQGGKTLSLIHFPKEKEINKGDPVFTGSLNNNFPKGLLIGKVEEINSSDINPFLEVKIKPAFSLKNSHLLLVISNFK